MRALLERTLRLIDDSPVAVAAALTALLLGPFLFGPLAYVLEIDSSDQTVPFFALGTRDIISGHFWHPYIEMGLDAVAMDIFNVADVALNAIFPPWLAYQVSLLGANLLGVWATIRLCQRLSISSIGAVAAALALVSMNSLGHTNHNALLLTPVVILWLGHPRFEKAGLRSIATAVGIGLLYAASTSAIFPIPFTLYLIVAWFIFVEPKRLSFWIPVAILELVVIVFKIPVILAMTGYSGESNRMLTPYRLDGLASIADAARFGASKLEFYFNGTRGYWLAYGVVLLGVIADRFRFGQPLVRIATLLVVTAVGMAVAYLIRPFIPDSLAGLRTFSILRIGYAVLPVLAVGFGAGADAIGAGLARIWHAQAELPTATAVGMNRVIGVLGLAGVLLTAGWPALWSELNGWLYVGTYTRIFDSPVLADLARIAKGQQVRAISIRMPPAWLATYGIETADGGGPMHPARMHRFWSMLLEPGKANPDPRISTAAHVFDVGMGDRPDIEIGDRPEDLLSGVLLSDHVHLDVLEFLNVRYVASLAPLLDAGIHLISGPKVNYFTLSQVQKLIEVLREDFTGRRNVYTYELPAFGPRFFLAPAVEIATSTDEVFAKVRQRTLPQLLHAVIVEAADAPAVDPAGIGFTNGTVTVGSYGPDRIVLTSESDGPGVLVAIMNYDKSWHALVDGSPVPTFPTYHAMIGLTVPKGTHQIDLVFDPPYRPTNIMARLGGVAPTVRQGGD